MTSSATAPSLLQDLAAYASRIRLDAVPEPVRRQAALCVLDTIGCIVSGADLPEAQLLLRAEAARGGAPQATVLCAAERLPLEGAVRVNGYMGDLLELNDLIGGHASIGVVTAALALAEARQASGAQLLAAVIAGIEVTARVYSGYYPGLKPFTEVGMSAVGFPSTIGVAAAAAHLMGLDETRFAHALANAGALAGWCPAEVVFGEGGSVKPMLFGSWPGTVGIMGAQYAEHGITGPLRLLESRLGFFVTAARQSDEAAVRDRETWHLAKPRRKLHACCGYIHSAIDTLVAMRQQGVDWQGVSLIRVGMPQYVIPAVSKSGPPASTTDALFHAEYCLALAAHAHDAIAPEHALAFAAHAAQPGVAALMRKIRIEPYAPFSHYHHSLVRLEDAQGKVLREETRTAPKGTPANPMDDAEVTAKFLRLVAPRLNGTAANDYVRRLAALEQQPAVDWLVSAFDRAQPIQEPARANMRVA